MALFSSMLRRRQTFSLFSIAIRSVGSARTFHREISTVPSIIPRCSVLPPRPFSTATAMKPAADDSLVGVLENEITAAQEDLDNHQVGEVADGFPFEIVDSPGEQTILLKRKYDGETIQVIVDNPNVGFSEENNEDDDDKAEEGDDANNEDTGIPMVVNISKGNGQTLEFGLTAFADEICVDSFSIMEPEGSKSNAYEGPRFEDLDESLQKALVKYLEVRGIKTSTTKFLQEYMRNKDFREYLMWLKNLKGFVEQ